jgi:hypothetical protein
MTPPSLTATNGGVGRTKVYEKRITLPLKAEMLARLDALRGQEERVAVIRRGVERELRAMAAKARRKCRPGRG